MGFFDALAFVFSDSVSAVKYRRLWQSLAVARDAWLEAGGVDVFVIGIGGDPLMGVGWFDYKAEISHKAEKMLRTFALEMMRGLAGDARGRVFAVQATVPPTPESLVLQQFFRLEADGGSLTNAQVDALFGTYEGEFPHGVVTAGILTLTQSQLLWEVSRGQLPPETLDRLLPGSGVDAITSAQVEAVSHVLTWEQISPVWIVLGERMQRAHP